MARTTDVVSISLPPEMVAELDLVCRIEHRTRSELIREALRRYYDRRPHSRGAQAQKESTCSRHAGRDFLLAYVTNTVSRFIL